MRTLACLSLLLIAVAAPAAVVQPLGTSNSVLIPAAGSTPGVNGTFFRSDITIVNLADHAQNVEWEWLPEPGGIGASDGILIPAHSGIRSTDFVKEYVHTTGIGSLLVMAVTNVGPLPVVDPTGKLFVASRIWTQQPGTNGTTSQSLPAIPVATINTPSAAIFALGGADDPPSYRVNIGVVNLDFNHEQTFAITWGPPLGAPVQTGTAITLPPGSMLQVPANGACCTNPITITNITPPATRSNLWTAYGSTINNVTGDAWDEIAVAVTSP
jgi:hypothetical protein